MYGVVTEKRLGQELAPYVEAPRIEHGSPLARTVPDWAAIRPLKPISPDLGELVALARQRLVEHELLEEQPANTFGRP